jgi:hypothetical protein
LLAPSRCAPRRESVSIARFLAGVVVVWRARVVVRSVAGFSLRALVALT